MEKWIIYAVVSMLFAGITAVIAKFGMKDLSSDTALAVRTTVVFIIVIANAFLFKNVLAELQQAPSKNLIYLSVSGITAALSWIFYYRAIKDGHVAYVASIDKASIVETLVLSFIILKEPVTPKILLGAAFVTLGLVILVWK